VKRLNLSKNAELTLEEMTIAEIHSAMKSGLLTCRSLTQMYLERIEAYDKKGPIINAILTINPKALEIADELDKTYAKTGFSGPLHGIPVLLKDNFDTADMPTTAGSVILAKSFPPVDGFSVRKLRQAGALILAKTNMHELALAGLTVSSLGGQTRNPYDLSRTPGGSSGGTGAAVASNFGVIGTGTDTVNSIRSPASANSLVGLRPTRGLVSRAGIVPVSFTQDAAGPITRTVADAARMLEVMAGYDPDDPATAWSIGHVANYTAFLDKRGLKGARIGILKTLFGTKPEHLEVNRVIDRAIEAMEKDGAILIETGDPLFDSDELIQNGDVQRWEFKTTFNNYLAGLMPNAPVKDLAQFIAVGTYHKPVLERFLTAAQNMQSSMSEVEYKDRLLRIQQLQQRIVTLMADHRLDTLVYPLQKRLVVPIGEENQADRTGILAALTGFPAIDVPAGFSSSTPSAPIGVPVGIEFFGRPWSESALIRFAYAFEQTTKFRCPPVSVPFLS